MADDVELVLWRMWLSEAEKKSVKIGARGSGKARDGVEDQAVMKVLLEKHVSSAPSNKLWVGFGAL